MNLGDLVEKPQPVNYGTTRIMRIYQHTGAKINLIQRIDWEIQIPNGKDKWVTKEDTARFKDDRWWEFSMSSLIRGNNKINNRFSIERRRR